ncbi:MAG: LysE family transporter [Desulfotignum sp.]|nr:LysE family transporter [Desulfotignum sp.]MCF8126492.1 LysE family transporter [Desulfotignum sp.]
MIHFMTIGLVLGLSAGLAPGPLLTLVVSETLRYHVGAGIRVALAPLISDLPIVVISVGLLSTMTDFEAVLGGISLVGGVVVFRMGWHSLKTRALVIEPAAASGNALAKGVLVNVLSPHPYMFWISVGAPVFHKAMAVNMAAAAAFISGFYLLLVGSKVALALLVGRSRSIIQGQAYVYTMRGLGLALCLLALVLVKDGLTLLGMM